MSCLNQSLDLTDPAVFTDGVTTARTVRADRASGTQEAILKAAERLYAEHGVFAVHRGEGTFVADEPSQPKRSERNEVLRDASNRYASAAISVGASLDDAVDELNTSYDKLVREHRRKV